MSHPLVRRLRQHLREHADARTAAEQYAYMKEIQPFLGVRTPLRRSLLKECLAGQSLPDFAAYDEVVRDLWQGRYREERYLALDVAARFGRFRNENALPLFEDMLADADWWDLLDPLAIDLIGSLLRDDARALNRRTRRWRGSSHRWTRRAALLVQLKHGQQTDTSLLAENILFLADESDFFIRKAIGWVLREYSKTDPAWVRNFVRTHERELSPLSRREALRRLDRKR